MTQKFGLLGFESFYFIKNMGSLGVILLIGSVVLVSLGILTRLDHARPRYPTIRNIVHMFFLDGIFSTLRQVYIVLILCCFINLKAQSKDERGVELSKSLTWTSLTVLFLFTLF